MQALPPFLAVHVNAAFTSLCGIQSYTAIGTPVASIVSLPDANASLPKESDSSSSDGTNNKDAMSSLSGSVDQDNNSQNNNSIMAIANVGGMQRGAEAGAAAPGAENTNLMQNGGMGLRIDRLIVARGYGHIHDVEVLSVPQNHSRHSHAIEGSEVKFVEGNIGNNPSAANHRKKGDSKILCRMSVSPVISTIPPDHSRHYPHTYGNSGCGADATHSLQSSIGNGKRRKTRPELNSVKHYLIQLEAVDGPRLLMSGSSHSATDTTMEARLLGITKSEVHARRCRLESRRRNNNAIQNQMMGAHQQQQHQGNNGNVHPETEGSQAENDSAMEPVATCG